MKKSFKISTIIIILLLVFTLTGCSNVFSGKFKNPTTVTISKNNTKISLTYDDNGKYDEDEISNSEVVITNSDKKFRIDFMYGSGSVKRQKKLIKYAKANNKLIVIDNIKFNGYKGYVTINKKYGTANIYLYMDDSIVSNIRISTTDTTEILEELNKRSPKDVLYKDDEIQSILKTIKFKK